MATARGATAIFVALLGCSVIGCSTRSSGANPVKVRRSSESSSAVTVPSTIALASSSTSTPQVVGPESVPDNASPTIEFADREAGDAGGPVTSTTSPVVLNLGSMSSAVASGDICTVNEAMTALPVKRPGTAALLVEIRQLRAAILASSAFAPPDLAGSWNALATGLGKVIDVLSRPGANARSVADSWGDPDFLEAQQETQRWMNANC